MVDAIVSMVLDQLASFAREEIQKEVRMLAGVTDEVSKLTKTFTILQYVLRDADEKQIQDDCIKVWLDNLKEVSYQIENVLDRWNTKLLRSKIKTGLANNKVSSNFFNPCFSFSNNIRIRRNVSREIKGLRKELEVIAHERYDFHLIKGTVVTEVPRLPERETSFVVNLSEVYGRDGDRDIVLNKLLGESSREKMGVDVIAIVAVGGLGKTTFAQIISSEVKNKFEENAWVRVSEIFEKEKIAKAIIKAFGGEVPTDYDWNTLHHLLTDTVKDKLFMLVLDDVWTENIKDWEPFKFSLEGGAPGSRILVTTRKEAVAAMMRSSHIHPLKELNEKNSWIVFCLAASLREDNGNYEMFEPSGREIMRKCKGVPLYLKAIGSVMSYKRNVEAWEDIMRSKIWETLELDNGVLPALLLSYYDLPSQVKPCFSYCAIYPKDYRLWKEELINFWMAQGFLYSQTEEALEKVGEEYFDTLVRRSLFQDIEIDDMGNVTHCKMHDLVHDLVQFLTKNEISVVDDIKDVKTSKIHHLLADVSKDTTSTIQAMIPSAKDLRTLFLSFESCTKLNDSFFLHLKCLRSLYLGVTRLDELPSEVGELIHLRYLDFSCTSLKKLPKSLCDLCNLQTLNFFWCDELCELPTSIGKMISLRHLHLSKTRITKLPESICDLRNLQTLSLDSCKELCELPKSMGMMKSLRLLDLIGISFTKLPESICDLCNLQNLNLSWCVELSELPTSIGKMISLQHLHLSFTRITELPESVCDLCNLQTLDLSSCHGLSELPTSMEKMKCLRYLKLEKTKKIKCLPRGIGKLASLQVSGLRKLDVSGANGSCTLGELKDLNIISKYLVITGFWGVDLASEAKRQVLDQSRDIKELVLHFDLPEGLQQLEDDTKRMEGVMECLQPHSNLEKLRIWDYIGSKLPSWMSSDFMSTWKLRRLYISGAPNLKTLPDFGKLKSLEELYLQDLDSLEYIGTEFFGISEGDVIQGVSGESLTVFPKLEKLTFWSMDMLEEWETKKERWREDVTFIMPCLVNFGLWDCKKLKALPHNIFSYQQVAEKISSCPELKQGSTLNQIIGRLHNSQTSRCSATVDGSQSQQKEEISNADYICKGKVHNEMEELQLTDHDDDEVDREKHFDASVMREPTKKDANFEEKKPLYIRPTTQLASCPTRIPPRAEEHSDALASRESTKKEVILALMDNNTKLVGVHGMGGIGKTTLVEQVCKEFEDTKLFDKVVLASISQNPDMRWIQTQIAESLGIQIEAKMMISARAEILAAELENQTQNILIILEDMWVKLELDVVGIILKDNTCKVKVLISSRSLDVCLSMNTSKNIHVHILSNEDSLELFHQEVGNVDSEKRMMSKEIVNECHGLPLAIVALATTLRRKDSVFWEAVTQLLKKSIYEGLDVVTTSIKRSYSYLQSSETKLCFLLCALFPKDHKILINVVLGYGMGEGLFGDGGTLIEARENLNLMLGRLVSFNLLLKDNEEGYVKMHNVVRNTALWIARGKRNESIIRTSLGINKWPNVDARRSLRISLMNNDINELPDTPDCSQLKTVSLASNQLLKEIPNCFFKDMNRLGALDLSETGISSLPQSLSYLKNCLRSLYLDGCKFLGNISAIGDLKELEILSVQRTEILELPEEIKGLINLKMLNLTGSRRLAAIPPDVISNLYSLEELYMSTSFHNWGIQGNGCNASLDEVASLFQLTCLHLDIKNPEWISTEISMCDWENLRTFCINLPFEEEEYDDRTRVYERYLYLRILANSYPLADWVKGLMENTAELILRDCEGVKSVLQLNPNNFQKLKSLTIKGSKTMEYVMHLEDQVTETKSPQLEVLKLFHLEKVKAIWNGPFREESFESLKVLRIEGCGSLVNILPSSLWIGLQNLEEIKIVCCPSLEELISKEYKETEELTDEYPGQEVEGSNNITIPLAHLRILDLQDLPRLLSLHAKPRKLLHVILECPYLETLQIKQCPNLKRFPFNLQSTFRLQEFIIDDDEWFQRLESEDTNVKSQLELVMTNINLKDKAEAIQMDQIIALLERADATSLPKEKELLNCSKRNSLGTQQLEPLQAFYCPITGDVMVDPVETSSGRTFERGVIEKWFADGNNLCPLTMTTLNPAILRPNKALRQSIEEWKNRNTMITIAALKPTLGSDDEHEVLRSLSELQKLCEEQAMHREWVALEKYIPEFIKLLALRSQDVKNHALELLCILAKDCDDCKERIAEVPNSIESIVRCLGESKLAVTLLLELLRSDVVCDKIGIVQGCIFLLVTMSTSNDSDAANIAKDLLDNLAFRDSNVIQMAKANYFKPLLHQLSSGTEETKLAMTAALAEMQWSDDNKSQLFEDGVQVPLLHLICHGDIELKKVSIRALQNLSSLPKNGLKMIKEGAVPPLLKLLYHHSASSTCLREQAAATIMNIAISTSLNEPVEPPVSVLDDYEDIFNLFSINYNWPVVQEKILRTFHAMCQSSSPADIRSKLRQCSAVQQLIQLFELDNIEVRANAVKLFCCLTEDSDDVTLLEHVNQKCIVTLLKIIETSQQEEEISAALGIISNLPTEPIHITQWLIDAEALPLISRFLAYKNEHSIYRSTIIDNAVGAIRRFTISSNQVFQKKACEAGIIPLLVELLGSGSSLTKKRAAFSLGEFSKSSNLLCKPVKKRGGFWCFSQPQIIGCPVHMGICSIESSYCIVEADAVEPLVRVIGEPDFGACEAALDALLTLIHEERLPSGSKFLNEANAVAPIIRLLSSTSVNVQDFSLEGFKAKIWAFNTDSFGRYNSKWKWYNKTDGSKDT